MTSDDVRAMALALPEAVELPHFQRSSFRVGKKIFATLTDGEAVVFVKPVAKLYALARAQPNVFVTNAWSKMGALGVVLARADRAQFHELLVASWRRIAPKRAIKKYEAK